ncbi:MFS transporter [Xylanimonas oleitrophica]|uniref:MFS transporter n=1 Tax=Xylanimonas oleitrophica TaxID=2607479 RepID=A0A2W5WUM8_9MICO|nr:MFS transporter [Xylanimonas oleitrophica]PZR54840.1 MFS transporter [Xylanimonas oleitrophica]
MSSHSADRARNAAWAVFVVFLANGFTFATWASRLPAVRDGLDFSERQMGLLVLTGAVGSVLALPLSGMIVARLGAARTVVIFSLVATAGYAVACVGVVDSHAMVVRAGLFLAGVGIGVWDASMNLEGAVVEQRLGRAIMPRFHAGFSFGTVAGAGMGAGASALGLPFAVHVVTGMVLALLAAAVCVRWFVSTPVTARAAGGAAVPEAVAGTGRAGESTGGEPTTAAPASAGTGAGPATAVAGGQHDEVAHGWRDVLATWREPRTLLIGLVVLAAALTEGAANDWLGLAVVDGFEASEATGALGLAIFLAAMTAARLVGTELIDRLGRVPVLRLSALGALVGVGLFVFSPWLWLALVGVVVWGAAAALGFPMGMSAASDDPRRAALRVSVVSTVGYSAFFIGPALIGLLAEHTGYRHALLVIAAPVVIGLSVAGAARPLPQAQAQEERA